jgi:hypothetical protein
MHSVIPSDIRARRLNRRNGWARTNTSVAALAIVISPAAWASIIPPPWQWIDDDAFECAIGVSGDVAVNRFLMCMA